MRPASQSSIVVGLIGIVFACSTTKEPSHAPKTASAQLSRDESINAEPTSETGVYRVPLVFREVTRAVVAPKQTGVQERRTLDPGRWSFDPSKNRITVRDAVDDSKELVILMGTPSSPPIVVLEPDAVVSTIRVVVGDHVGVSGRDYVVDDAVGLVRLLGPESPEARLRYYLEYSTRADPAHPERARTCSVGNRGDMNTIRRLLDAGAKG